MKAHIELESKMEIRIKNFFSISMELNQMIAYINEDGDENFTAARERLYTYNHYNHDNLCSAVSQETDYQTEFQVTAKECMAKVRAEVSEAKLILEWEQTVKMKGNSICHILNNAMFQCLKRAKDYLESDGSSAEILHHPLTCGLFYWYTFQRILISKWAENHVMKNSRVIYIPDKGEQVNIILDSPLPVFTDFCAYIKKTDKVFGSLSSSFYPPHKQTMSLTMEDQMLNIEELRKHIFWKINEEETETESFLGCQCTELDILYIYGVTDWEHWTKSMHMIGKQVLSMSVKTQEERFRERRILMTREMEEALRHSEEDQRPVEERPVIAVYYLPSSYYEHMFTLQKRPYREWYIISGKQQEDGDWVLYGLIYDRKWKWGEVLFSRFQENFNLRVQTRKRPDVFGRKLRDVLEEYGNEGWESALSESSQQNYRTDENVSGRKENPQI